jgi:transcription elongation GreA/GreB family factor
MDKQIVIDAFVTFFRGKVENMAKRLEGTRDVARAAPGSNVSHSDTSKHQLSELALGIDVVLSDYQLALNYMQALPRTTIASIATGTLFTLYDTGNDEYDYYLLVTKGGGESVEVDEIRITTLSSDSPLAKLCFGKRTGEVVIINHNVFRVTEIL